MASEDWKLWLFGNKNPTICCYFESFIYWLLIFSVIVHFALNLNRPFVPLSWSLGWETLIKSIIFEQNSERETRSVKLLCSRPRPNVRLKRDDKVSVRMFPQRATTASNNSKVSTCTLVFQANLIWELFVSFFLVLVKGVRNCHVCMMFKSLETTKVRTKTLALWDSKYVYAYCTYNLFVPNQHLCYKHFR